MTVFALLRAAAGAALLALAACGPGGDPVEREGPSMERRDAGADRREGADAREDADGRFEYLRYAADESGDDPRLCLVFSAALDPEADYSAYVEIGGDAALSADGRRLCVGGLSYGQTREITLREGLPAADGRELDADVTETLTFADRPAFVRFSGSGVILPRIDADGVGIETVNVDAVTVRVSRVTDRALAFKAITEGFSAGEGEWGWASEDERPGEAGVEIFEGEMDTSGDPNAPATTVFPFAEAVERLRPGAYFIEVQDAGAAEDGADQPARAERWLIVTDLAFTAYRGDSGLDVVLRGLQDARPAADTRVRLIARSNEILAERRTDGQGRVRFGRELMAGTDGNAPHMLMAYGRNGDFAVLDLTRQPVDLSENAISGRERAGAADGYVWLDRGIYRPGETIRASALLRGPENNALTNRPGVMTLYAPNGLEYARHRFQEAPEAGAVIHAFELPDAAARGRWRIAVEVDGVGEVSSRALSVEDFVPQRVALELEADGDAPLRAGQTRMIEAQARFLYGAPGAGLPMGGVVRVQEDPSPFEDHADFKFGLHDEAFAEETFDLPATTADGQGRGSLPVRPGRRGADSAAPLRLRAVVEVAEPGGRAVADDVILPYRPRDLYVGLAGDFDGGRSPEGRPVRHRVAALDAAGDPVRADLDWRLVRNDYDYDWYRTEDGEWRWRRSRRVVEIEDGVVSARAEDGSALIETEGLDWGDYTLFVSADGEDLASAGFQVGYGGEASDADAAPDRVRLTGPARPPRVGERAEVTIQAPYEGRAEVVIATDRVIETRSINVPEDGARLTLQATESWGAGAYVMVSVYTPRDAAERPVPRRAVGVLHIPVSTAARSFELDIDAPERVEPRQSVEIEVSAASGPVGEEGWLTLAAVDEGILRLTGFDSPDPRDWFFAPLALGVDLLDDYGRLLDPNQGPAADVRSGGDQIGGAGLSVVPTRTVALFEGPIEFDGGRAVVPLEIPDFNGELRLMAVAWSRTGMGAADQAMTVRDDVPAELILPRFLSPGDEAFATVSLDNVDGEPGDYAVSLTADGPLRLGEDNFALALDEDQRAERAVSLTAGEEGIGRLGLSVSGPGEFETSRDYPIQIRSAFLPVSGIERIVLEPGESYQPGPEVFANFIAGSESLQVSVAASPIDAAAIYEALSDYPYGCTEQTISRAMPLLYAAQMSALEGTDASRTADAEVQAAIQTLLSRQSEDGAFGLWRIGDQAASPWLGAYAADFLVRAEAAGHPVPDAALDRALDALVPVARGDLWRAYGYQSGAPDPRWSTDTEQRLNDRSAAYAAYVLARAGRADRSRLRYLHDERIGRIDSPLARAQIGAALASIGDRARASSAFDAAAGALGYENSGDVYQSPRRDLAGVLALAAEAGQTDRVEGLAEQVAADLPEPERLTTQEQAFLLLAARALAGEADALSLTADGEAADQTVFSFDRETVGDAPQIANEGDSPVWVTAFARGAPSSPPEAADEGLAVAKTLRARDGSQIDPGAIQRGDQLIAALTVTPRQAAAAQLIVEDLLPAGFEIEGVLRPEEAAPDGPYRWLGELTSPRVAEARDDRFVAALDSEGRTPMHVAYMVRAVTPGRFTLPGAVAEDMYRPEIFARSEAGSVTVED